MLAREQSRRHDAARRLTRPSSSPTMRSILYEPYSISSIGRVYFSRLPPFAVGLNSLSKTFDHVFLRDQRFLAALELPRRSHVPYEITVPAGTSWSNSSDLSVTTT